MSYITSKKHELIDSLKDQAVCLEEVQNAIQEDDSEALQIAIKSYGENELVWREKLRLLVYVNDVTSQANEELAKAHEEIAALKAELARKEEALEEARATTLLVSENMASIASELPTVETVEDDSPVEEGFSEDILED